MAALSHRTPTSVETSRDNVRTQGHRKRDTSHLTYTSCCGYCNEPFGYRKVRNSLTGIETISLSKTATCNRVKHLKLNQLLCSSLAFIFSTKMTFQQNTYDTCSFLTRTEITVCPSICPSVLVSNYESPGRSASNLV